MYSGTQGVCQAAGVSIKRSTSLDIPKEARPSGTFSTCSESDTLKVLLMIPVLFARQKLIIVLIKVIGLLP